MIESSARDAWSEIEKSLRRYVARRAAAGDVDDILQDIWLRMHRSIGGLRDDASFGGWMYRIAEHAIADSWRARARDSRTREHLAPELTSTAPAESADDDLRAELGECIALFIARLPSPYRQAVTLTELQGLTQKQAAEMLGTSLSGLKSRVQRGRAKLRALFETCCHVSLDVRGRVVGCEPRTRSGAAKGCGASAPADES